MSKAFRSGRPPRCHLEARRKELLATALQLFIVHGYPEVSLAAIASAAHVAVRTIYVKFGGKAGLLNALIEAERQRHHQQLTALDTRGGVMHQLESYAGHLVRRARDEGLARLHAIVIANGNDTARAAWRAAGTGQLAPRLELLFSQAEAQALFGDELAVQDLCIHFLHCIAGHVGADYRMTLLSPKEEIRRGLRLFLLGTRGC